MARKKSSALFYFQGIPGLFMLALIIASLAGLVLAVILISSGNFDLSAEARSRRGVFCSSNYAPVCGTNGRTYSNDCFARRAGATVAYKGTCSGGPARAIPAPLEY